MSRRPSDLEANLQQHGAALRRLAADLLGDASAAEDAVQETWLVAMQHPPRRPEAAGGWLRTVLHNVVRRQRRGTRRRQQREAAATREQVAEDPAMLLAREEQLHRLVAAVMALSPPCREAIWQRYFEGAAPRAIARSSGVPHATVKGRLQRGLLQLRERLGRDDPGDWRAGMAMVFGCKPAAVPIATAKVGAGVLLMSTWLKLSAAVVLVAMLGSLWWLRSEPQHEPAVLGKIAAAAPAGTAEPDATAAAPQQRTPVAAATTGSLQAAVRWKHDGQPAADVVVLGAEGDGMDAGEWRELGISDAQGQLRIDGLAPGWLAVRPQFVDQPKWCAIDAGAVDREDLELDARTVVQGMVVDREGKPVGGAEVWLSKPLRTGSGEVVTHSDAYGAFSVGFVGDGRCVAARAAGVGASLPMPILPCVTTPVPVRIELSWPSWPVEGVVIDQDGRPVAGATVVVGDWLEQGPTLFRSMQWRGRDAANTPLAVPQVVTKTDARGHFAATTCRRSRDPYIVVWAPGHGAKQELSADARLPLRIVLAPEAVVAGQVCGHGGQPLAGIAVSVYPLDWHTVDPDADPWLHWSTRTDANGAFSVVGLPANRFHLEARDALQGSAVQLAVLAAGQRFCWDPVFDRGQPLVVRVRDGDREPVRGCEVHIHGSSWMADKRQRNDNRYGRTDANGLLRFENCQGAFSIHAGPTDGFLSWPASVRNGVRPGDGECEIVIADLRPASARLLGVVCDAGDNPLASAAEMWFRPGSEETARSHRDFALAARPFRIGPLHDGIYKLTLRVAGFAPLELENLRIENGRDLELGTLRLERAGILSASLTDAQGSPCPADRVWLVRGANMVTKLDGFPSPPIAFRNLLPGDYQLVAWSDLQGLARQRVRVLADTETQVGLQLSPSVACEVDVRALHQVRGGARLRWLDAAGDLLGEEHVDLTTNDPLRVFHRRLPIGGYRLELCGWDLPLVGAVDFQVVETMPAPVVLDVRQVDRDEWHRWRR